MGKEADRLWERLTGTKRERKPTVATVRAHWKKEAGQLPKEERQKLLDAIWKHRDIAVVAELFGMSEALVSGVVALNTYTVKRLRRETL